MPITPTTPNFPFGTTFPSSPISEDMVRQNATNFSSTDSLDGFDHIPEYNQTAPTTASNLEVLNFIEGICQNFTVPTDVKNLDPQISAIFSKIAIENARPVQPGTVYRVFEHTGVFYNLENAVRTLTAGGTVNIKTAVCSLKNELRIIPERTVTIRNFDDLIRWDFI